MGVSAPLFPPFPGSTFRARYLHRKEDFSAEKGGGGQIISGAARKRDIRYWPLLRTELLSSKSRSGGGGGGRLLASIYGTLNQVQNALPRALLLVQNAMCSCFCRIKNPDTRLRPSAWLSFFFCRRFLVNQKSEALHSFTPMPPIRMPTYGETPFSLPLIRKSHPPLSSAQ